MNIKSIPTAINYYQPPQCTAKMQVAFGVKPVDIHITPERAEELLQANRNIYNFDNPDGLKHYPPPKGFDLVKKVKDEETGFKAGVYKNNAHNEIIVALAGADSVKARTGTIKSMMIRGKVTPQFKPASGLIDKIKNDNPNAQIIVTGHSLGGTLAQLLGAKNPDVRVYAFSPIGAKNHIKNNPIPGINLSEPHLNITNYIVEGDLIRKLGKGSFDTIGETFVFSPRHTRRDLMRHVKHNPKELAGLTFPLEFIAGSQHDFSEFRDLGRGKKPVDYIPDLPN